jgi:hypothetical protein
MMFAAAVGHRSGRAMPSLRDAPQQQSMEIVGRETIYRNRNAVQTNPATSLHGLHAPSGSLSAANVAAIPAAAALNLAGMCLERDSADRADRFDSRSRASESAHSAFFISALFLGSPHKSIIRQACVSPR